MSDCFGHHFPLLMRLLGDTYAIIVPSRNRTKIIKEKYTISFANLFITYAITYAIYLGKD